MSYARSPRLVCSTTMGTSMFCGSLLVLTPTLHEYRFFAAQTSSLGSKGESRMQAALCGPAVQCIQGLLVADAMPNSIQPSILRQTRSHLLDGLLRLVGQRLQLTVKFLVTDFNLLLVSDLLQDQRCLYFPQCSLTLTGAQASEVHALH